MMNKRRTTLLHYDAVIEEYIFREITSISVKQFRLYGTKTLITKLLAELI